jgi:hypothetical protein
MSSSGSVKLRYENCLGIWGNASPNTTGHKPSVSSSDSVNASVWQMPVCVIFTNTSPLRGGATSHEQLPFE